VPPGTMPSAIPSAWTGRTETAMRRPSLSGTSLLVGLGRFVWEIQCHLHSWGSRLQRTGIRPLTSGEKPSSPSTEVPSSSAR